MHYTPRPFTGYRVNMFPTKTDRRKGKNNILYTVRVFVNNNIITINHQCYLPTGRRRLLITVVPNPDARTTVTVKTGVA